MNPVTPIVRYFVLCQDFLIGPSSPNDISLIKLIYSTRAPDGLFPLALNQICAFAALANARGVGEIDVRVVEADTGDETHRTGSSRIDFGSDPLRIHGLPIRLRHCVFPSIGLYSVELCYNGSPIAQQDLLVR